MIRMLRCVSLLFLLLRFVLCERERGVGRVLMLCVCEEADDCGGR